jgi:3-oxoacyl-[acyl-carrier-protein] synthase-3
LAESDVGIVDWTLYIPKNFVTAEEIARETAVHGIDADVLIEKFGIVKKCISDPNEHVSDMCVKAAKSLLDKTGLDPLDIDILVYNGSQFTDYYVWPVAPEIQHRIGAENAWCYDLHALCVGGPLALYQVKALLLSDESWENALIVSGTKESYLIDYRDRDTSFMWDFADGASAVWLKKGHGRNRILSGSFVTDGYYNHVYNNSGSRGLLSDVPKEKMRYIGVESSHREKMGRERKGYRDFRELSRANFVRVIKESVRKSGYSVEDINYVALLHLIPSFRRQILGELGLNEDEHSSSLDEYGHLQSTDWVLSLDLGVRQGKIRDGNLVVAVGAGTGFSWGATAIKWG